MCRQAVAEKATNGSEKLGPFSPSPDNVPPRASSAAYRPDSAFGWDRHDEEALKDDTVTNVPFCFQLPRLLPKCSKAKLLFSTFVQGLFHTTCSYSLIELA